MKYRFDEEPLVSAYVVTKNRPTSLVRACRSIACQTYFNIELVIVNDGSTVDYTSALEEIADLGIDFIYISHSTSRGACAARNTAILSSNGTFLAGLDDDDEWTPDRVVQLLQVLRDTGASVAFADDYIQDEAGKKKKTRKPSSVVAADLLFENYIGNQILCAKELFVRAGLFDVKLTASQDHDMWLRILEMGGTARKSPHILQVVHVEGRDRISKSPRRFSGYFNFYKKYKAKCTKQQRKHLLLTIKYLTRETIGISVFIKLLSWHNPKRLTGIFFRRTIIPMLF